MSHQVNYQLIRSERRSIALIVRPDGGVEVRAPRAITQDTIDEFLSKKQLWLKRRLDEFERYRKPFYEKRYLSGESFRYLGRQYILKVVPDGGDFVRIEGRKLAIHSSKALDDADWNRRLVQRWLDGRKTQVFMQQYREACCRFGLREEQAPQLRIKSMRTRWGSYSHKTNTVYLNARLVEAPTEAIRMVCIHELCHLKHRAHDKAFYAAMDRYQDANWRRVKEKLEIQYG